jgi:PadR family transcriptional regulator, regulatory protein PadR
MQKKNRNEIQQRIIKNLLDIQLLRMVKTQPTWGYQIKKQVQKNFDIKLRHGALYPTLNDLEKKGFLTSQRQQKEGRARKVYSLTKEGKDYLEAYFSVLNQQLEK